MNSISHEKNSQERSSIVSHGNTGLIKKTQEKRAVSLLAGTRPRFSSFLTVADSYKICKAKSKF